MEVRDARFKPLHQRQGLYTWEGAPSKPDPGFESRVQESQWLGIIGFSEPHRSLFGRPNLAHAWSRGET